jgi:hypothetical protein
VTQELYRHLPVTIHTIKHEEKIKTRIEINGGSKQQLLRLEQQPEALDMKATAERGQQGLARLENLKTVGGNRFHGGEKENSREIHCCDS